MCLYCCVAYGLFRVGCTLLLVDVGVFSAGCCSLLAVSYALLATGV